MLLFESFKAAALLQSFDFEACVCVLREYQSPKSSVLFHEQVKRVPVAVLFVVDVKPLNTVNVEDLELVSAFLSLVKDCERNL